MKPADDIKRFFKNANLSTDPAADEAVFDKVLKASETKNTKPAHQHGIWRIIMQSKITKLTAAAAIILVGMIIVNQFGGSVDLATPAYAIEQTLDAMQHIETIHLFGRNWGNREFEMWMQLNPETGIPDYIYSDHYETGTMAISRPDKSYQYNRKSNRVTINSGKLYHIGIAPAKIFEQLLQASKNPNNPATINIYHEQDSETGKTLIVIYFEMAREARRIYIDPETKLPVRFVGLKSGQVGEIFKDIDFIEYNVELPEGIFDFEILDDTEVVDADHFMKLYNDPQYGISTKGLTEKQAAEKIITDYWDALIAGNKEISHNLSPGSTPIGDGSQLLELVKVGEPYIQPGCGIGKVVPCRIRFADGALKEIKLIIRFRNIKGQESCVIAGTYGGAIKIEE